MQKYACLKIVVVYQKRCSHYFCSIFPLQETNLFMSIINSRYFTLFLCFRSKYAKSAKNCAESSKNRFTWFCNQPYASRKDQEAHPFCWSPHLTQILRPQNAKIFLSAQFQSTAVENFAENVSRLARAADALHSLARSHTLLASRTKFCKDLRVCWLAVCVC